MFDRLFNSKSISEPEDLILWFERKLNRKYPELVRRLLQTLTNNPNEITVEFIASNYGSFEILNFKELKNVLQERDTDPTYAEFSSNPYYIVEKIAYYIEKELPHNPYLSNTKILPYLNNTKVLPFARSNYADKTKYIYFIENNPAPIFLNVDGGPGPLTISVENINDLIEVENLITNIINSSENTYFFNKKMRPENLISESKIFICDSEIIDNVDDYQWVIEGLLSMTNGIAVLNYFSGTAENDHATIDLKINDVEQRISLSKIDGWIDMRIIDFLNSIIEPIYDGNKFYEFFDFDFGQEFGIFYGGERDRELFAVHGYIEK